MYLAALAAAGLFSTRAITANDEVLARGKKCGWQGEFPEASDLTASDIVGLNTANSLLIATRYSLSKSKAYARSCYGSDVDLSTSCSYYVQQKINSTIKYDAPCPVAVEACATPAMSIESGIISSDQDLGINLRNQDKISLRKTTTCSPILGEKYATTINSTFKGYSFGPSADLSEFSQYTSFILDTSDMFDYHDYGME